MHSEHAIFKKAESIFSQLSEWRRYLHRYPELSFNENNTASFVAKQLRNIPEINVLVGKEETGLETGVVGILKKGEGPVVALRADMDALPITEETEAVYQSEHKGVMHACGHDAHTTILLGAAHVLSERESTFSGTIKFIFQPAEEATDDTGSSGAPYFINHGLLDDVSVAFALHMDPEFTPGHIRLHEGPSMANVDTFQAVIKGTGGHGAYPHLGTDPVWMLSFVIQAVQGITSRRTSPLDPAVISIGEIRAGSSTNVIPEEVKIQGTLRSYDKQTRIHLERELHQAFSIVESMGGSYKLEVEKGEPALNNDKKSVQILESTIEEIFPNFYIKHEPYGLGGEDFGYIADRVPAAMLFLGAGFTDKSNKGLHMPGFDIQENILPVGVSILVGSAIRYLQ
ncbi:amidohydrolase [Salibacterium salarium]|uniref:M20 metallopeptidase family protein n=1 Tax=Salibacterium salarium TaxID=284579 RepID=UPI00277F270D|nr:M20 family metallopeptidase [Salibacterium salarium]MDQ0299369.1 amidohydrolase [Salibacterium salarium]